LGRRLVDEEQHDVFEIVRVGPGNVVESDGGVLTRLEKLAAEAEEELAKGYEVVLLRDQMCRDVSPHLVRDDGHARVVRQDLRDATPVESDPGVSAENAPPRSPILARDQNLGRVESPRS
jgi:hypothetical protein